MNSILLFHGWCLVLFFFFLAFGLQIVLSRTFFYMIFGAYFKHFSCVYIYGWNCWLTCIFNIGRYFEFSIWLQQFTLQVAVYKNSNYSMFFNILDFLKSFSHSNDNIVVYYHGFIFHFLYVGG